MTNSITKFLNLFLFVILFILSASSIIVAKNVTANNNIIYIDPGHGGRDGGAIGKNSVYEKKIVLEISLLLKKYLNDIGYTVFLTRSGDYDLATEGSKNRKREDIHKRVEMINDSNCLLYVSIHANIYPNDQVSGAQVFYNDNCEKSKELANEIQGSIITQLLNTRRQAKTIKGKYLIDHVERTGCMVEVGFLSNPKEMVLLNDPVYQDKMAYAIFLGICSFLEKNLQNN